MLALVVDDSRAMRAILTRLLSGLGFDVAQAGHGEEALSVLDAGTKPDVILVDWNMPVMDGLQFVSAVRSNPAWRGMTIMMVTSESEQTQIARMIGAAPIIALDPSPAARDRAIEFGADQALDPGDEGVHDVPHP